jgi:hypothetical protein
MGRFARAATIGLGLFMAGIALMARPHPGLFMSISAVQASEPAPTAEPKQLASAAWWRERAVHDADAITDADARSQAHYELAYVRARAGDLAGAAKSATQVKNPQLRIFAHCFVAKQYKQQGDDGACRSELQRARAVALPPENILRFCPEMIEAYMEMGYPADAVSLAAEIPAEFQRNCAFEQVAGLLAKRGDMAMAYDVVKQHIPPSWEEAALSTMANACAQELRVGEARKLAARLTDTKYRDNAYVDVVDALVRADRHEEAGKIADHISDAARKAAAQATIAHASLKNQSIESLQAQIEKATTRDEKLALYDLLFFKRIDSGNVAAAEAAIESMVEIIRAFPRKAEVSELGTADDAACIAMAQSRYLLEVARLLVQKGDREGSLRRIALARKAVTELSEQAGLGKAMLVAELVGSEIEVGDFRGARSTLGQLRAGYTRSSAAARVAAGLIKSGDVKAGLEVAELITDPVGRGEAIGRVASALLRAGEPGAARAVLRKVAGTPAEGGAFRAAGTTMVESGRGSELHQWIGEMDSTVARAYACTGAAEVLQKK